MTNCCECKYGYGNRCKDLRLGTGCYECDNFNFDTLECKCTEVEDDTNCPNFEEYDGGNDET